MGESPNCASLMAPAANGLLTLDCSSCLIFVPAIYDAELNVSGIRYVACEVTFKYPS